MMIRSLVAAFGMTTLSACGMAGAHAWSLNAVINREDSIVAVWRRAEYGGGQFNGFDKTPVSISAARYVAYEMDLSQGPPRIAKIPVNFEYGGRSDLTPDPDFGLVGGQVVVSDCAGEAAGRRDGSATCGVYAGKPFELRQLGGRAEDVSVRGDKIVFRSRTGVEQCALALDLLEELFRNERQDPNGITLQVSYFPKRADGFVSVAGGEFPVVYGIRDCGAPIRYDLANYRAALDGLRDIRLRDVALGADGDSPVMLIDWTRAEAGVFKEHAGVLDLGRGKLQVISTGDAHPIGFWGGGDMSVLLSAEAVRLPQDSGIAELAISVHDFEKAADFRLSAEIPLE